jgi:carbamoyl-phosphate synthase large subunit
MRAKLQFPLLEFVFKLMPQLNSEKLAQAKSLGFSDRQIAHLTGTTEDKIRALRKKLGLVPSYRLVDTCAAEFEAYTPYYYSTYDRGDERDQKDIKEKGGDSRRRAESHRPGDRI